MNIVKLTQKTTVEELKGRSPQAQITPLLQGQRIYTATSVAKVLEMSWQPGLYLIAGKLYLVEFEKEADNKLT